MNSYTRRVAALVVLATVLCLPLSAYAEPRERDGGRDPGKVVRIIKQIKKLFGVGVTDDLPGPPVPKG